MVAFYGSVLSDYLYDDESEVTLIFHAAVVVIGFFKFLSLGRIYNRFSFIVKMLVRVYEELVPFLILFTSFIVVFAWAIKLVGVRFDYEENLEENSYKGLDFFAYITFVARASLADFDLDHFYRLPVKSRLAAWMFWLMIVISNTVIFLNFLVAVISDVYEQVMETRIEEVYQKQAELIVE